MVDPKKLQSRPGAAFFSALLTFLSNLPSASVSVCGAPRSKPLPSTHLSDSLVLQELCFASVDEQQGAAFRRSQGQEEEEEEEVWP